MQEAADYYRVTNNGVEYMHMVQIMYSVQFVL